MFCIDMAERQSLCIARKYVTFSHQFMLCTEGRAGAGDREGEKRAYITTHSFVYREGDKAEFA